ncbi:MAG: TlpA family protein disulfide reductase [Saprospiraceae bacterium]|nr:TlpA family protein disulfide reductase [Saprospiraceae bacterium]
MLKYPAIILFAGLFSINTYAQQQAQPTQPFPFSVTLTQTDSSELDSRKVFETGKPTVVSFWLTTCMPCLAEFAAYTKNYADWKQQTDFNLLGISLDFPGRFNKIAPMAAEKKWPFPVYWDRIRAFKQIMPGGLNGMPQVFLFDKTGKLVWQHKGYSPGMEQVLFEKIKAL